MKNSSRAFGTLITIFFFWGFVAASNDILIPVFKKALNLSQLKSQMISFAFYVAYTVGSVLYVLISAILKKDILLKLCCYLSKHNLILVPVGLFALIRLLWILFIERENLH